MKGNLGHSFGASRALTKNKLHYLVIWLWLEHATTIGG
jgi:hypothetical protein